MTRLNTQRNSNDCLAKRKATPEAGSSIAKNFTNGHKGLRNIREVLPVHFASITDVKNGLSQYLVLAHDSPSS